MIANLEEALSIIKDTDNKRRIAECNNILQIVWDCREQVNEGIPHDEIFLILDEVSVRVENLINNPESAGNSDLIK